MINNSYASGAPAIVQSYDSNNSYYHILYDDVNAGQPMTRAVFTPTGNVSIYYPDGKLHFIHR